MLTIELPVDNTAQKIRLTQICLEQIWCKKNTNYHICIPNFLSCLVLNFSFFQNIFWVTPNLELQTISLFRESLYLFD